MQGTVTPYEYTIALAENAVDNGVEIRTRREVLKIDREATSGMFTLAVKHWEPAEYTEQHADDPTGALAGLTDVQYTYSPSPGTVMGGKAGDETYRCRYVINAAGCASDKVAAMVGDTSWHVKPRMGEYILLNKNQGHVARHVLFPCPHPVYGKGVLVQSTLWGNLILGPTARDTMIKNQAGVYEPDPEVLNEPTDNIMGYLVLTLTLILNSRVLLLGPARRYLDPHRCGELSHCQHPHRSTLTAPPSPLHPHRSTLTAPPSPLHPNRSTLTTPPSPLHPHHSTLTTFTISLLPHLLIYSLTHCLSINYLPFLKLTLLRTPVPPASALQVPQARPWFRRRRGHSLLCWHAC